jgi:ABC-type transport system involved in cytochrome c biogenesis ATPase subunit
MTLPPEKDQLQFSNEDIVIRTEGLTVRFGHETAVEDLSFEVPRGKIFGFIGPSGSGKTTTVRLLTGFYKPTTGMATVLGYSPTEFKQVTRQKIGYMTQLFALYPELTVWENLNFAASIYGMSFQRSKRLDELLEFVELIDHKRKLARNLSGGMKRRLRLVATLGIGFVISLISKTDTQAVQYSKIVLLTSVFFSGFILGLETLWRPVRIISWALPATYGILMLRNIMLSGDPLAWGVFFQLAVIGVGLFVLAWVLLRRSMAHS